MDIKPHAINTRPKHNLYTIGELDRAIKERQLGKPYIQRKKVWKVADIRSWVTHIIQERTDFRGFLINRREGLLYIWDGNNRVNAIYYFKKYPLRVFDQFIKEFFGEVPADVTGFLQKIPYDYLKEARNLDRLVENGPASCQAWASGNRDADLGLERLQRLLRLWDIDSVQIYSAEWENATDAEMAERYEHANRGGAPLKERDILAASTDKIRYTVRELGGFHPFIRDNIEKYYSKGDGEDDEVLGVEFNADGELNLFQVIMGFHAYLRDKFPLVIPPISDDVKLDLVFDIYKYMMDDDKFAKKVAILEFLTKLHDCCKLVDDICRRFKTSEIKNKGVAKQSECLFQKNNILRVLGLAYVRHEELSSAGFQNVLARVILYHEFVKALPKGAGAFHANDYLTYKAGGNVVPAQMKQIKTAKTLGVMPSKEDFTGLMQELIRRECNERGSGETSRKSGCSAFVGCMLNMVYNYSVPPAMKTVAHDLDHIVPFSAVWEEGVVMDINRLGNMAAIDSAANKARSNKPITDEFVRTHLKYYNYPSEAEYNRICEEKKEGRKRAQVWIKDAAAFNAMCERRESEFIRVVLAALGFE